MFSKEARSFDVFLLDNFGWKKSHMVHYRSVWNMMKKIKKIISVEKKLLACGFQNKSLSFIESYFTNRQHRSKTGGSFSEY